MKLHLWLAVACASVLQAVTADAPGRHVHYDADNGFEMDAACDSDREANPSWKYPLSTSEHEEDQDTFDLWEHPHHRHHHQRHHWHHHQQHHHHHHQRHHHHRSKDRHKPHHHANKHGQGHHLKCKTKTVVVFAPCTSKVPPIETTTGGSSSTSVVITTESLCSTDLVSMTGDGLSTTTTTEGLVSSTSLASSSSSEEQSTTTSYDVATTTESSPATIKSTTTATEPLTTAVSTAKTTTESSTITMQSTTTTTELLATAVTKTKTATVASTAITTATEPLTMAVTKIKTATETATTIMQSITTSTEPLTTAVSTTKIATESSTTTMQSTTTTTEPLTTAVPTAATTESSTTIMQSTTTATEPLTTTATESLTTTIQSTMIATEPLTTAVSTAATTESSTTTLQSTTTATEPLTTAVSITKTATESSTTPLMTAVSTIEATTESSTTTMQSTTTTVESSTVAVPTAAATESSTIITQSITTDTEPLTTAVSTAAVTESSTTTMQSNTTTTESLTTAVSTAAATESSTTTMQSTTTTTELSTIVAPSAKAAIESSTTTTQSTMTTTESLTTTVSTTASTSLSSPTTSPTPTPDPCLVATSANAPIAFDVAKACLDADFPFPADNRVKTAESIKKLLLNSFVFEDLAANPPAVPGLTLKPAPIAGDIDALLGMRANAVQTYREFHEGISDIFIKARDAHLAYSADCFNQFSFDHGFTFIDMIDNTGERALKVFSVQPSFSTLSSLDFSPEDCSIVTINDMSAYQFIQTWADNFLDISKDAAIRYNSAIGGPVFTPKGAGYSISGQFSQRNRLPAESSLKFGFICPQLWGPSTVEQVVVKWGATFNGSPRTVSQYYTTYCSANSPETSSSTTTNSGNQGMSLWSSKEQDQYGHQQEQQQQQAPFNNLPEPAQEHAITKIVEEFKAMPYWLAKRTQEVILGPATVEDSKLEWTDEMDEEVLRAQAERILREMPAFDPVPRIPLFDTPDVHRMKFHRFAASAQDYQILLESSLGVHAILLGDNKTGVITIPTFNPAGGSSTGSAQFYASLIEAITVLRPMAEKLILDLSRNGGGSICLSRRALQLFFPETPQVITNFRYSDLEALLIQTGYTSTSTYLRSNDTVVDSAYMSTTVSHPNRQFNFTNYISDDCASFTNDKLPVDPTEESKRPRAVKNGYVYDPNAVYHPWDAQDIIIFDEGTCGSACATFANQLHQKNKVKAVVVTNAEGADKAVYSSFSGGQVLQAEGYFETYRTLKKAFNIQALSDSAKQAKDSSTGQLDEQHSSLYKSQDDSLFHAQATFTQSQGETAVKLLPEPLQHSANLSVTWRQTYNTGDIQTLFTTNSAGKIVPNWPVDPAAWTEYSFLPADFRINYTLNSYISYHHLWENARDAVWK